MPESGKKSGGKLPVREQVSAGGVVFRGEKDRLEVVIVSVGGQNRWQLPKGLVDAGEKPEITAVREAREEAGVDSEVVQHLETIEYWFAGLDGGERVRFHKHVHFYLLRYLAGDARARLGGQRSALGSHRRCDPTAHLRQRAEGDGARARATWLTR